MLELLALKDLLNQFSVCTGMKVKYRKTSMIHINITLKRCNELAKSFICESKRSPYTYLGSPMWYTKPEIDNFINIIERI
jgi:hypothetical protein